MKINIHCGYEEFDDPYNYKRNYQPFAKVNIDISKEELECIKRDSKETHFSLMRMIGRACDEADRGIQVY